MRKLDASRGTCLTVLDYLYATVADYAAQALVSTLIGKVFPEYPLIGEEDATDLRTDDQASVRDKIVELANKALSEDSGTPEDQAVWDVVGKEALPTEEWLSAIDRGNAKYSNTGRESLLDSMQQVYTC